MQKQQRYNKSNKASKKQQTQYTKLQHAHEEYGMKEYKTIRKYYAFLSNGRVLDVVARFRREAINFFEHEAALHGLTVESVHYYYK